MARITDHNKLERLKQSTMKLVAAKGYGGASALSIALDAKVSTGYFYMHYKGKYELVNSLLLDFYEEIVNKLDELINKGYSFKLLIENLVDYFITLANNEPVKTKFFYVLSSNYRFKTEHEIKKLIFDYIKKLMNMGYKEGVLDKNLLPEDIYLFLLINTFQFINQRFKNDSEKVYFSKEDERHLLYLINKILA